MNRTIAALLALVLLVPAAQAQQKRTVMLDKVVAIVGSESVLYSDVNDMAEQITLQRRQQGYTSDRDPKAEALERLMMQKLLYQQALLDSVKINTADLMSRVEQNVQNLIAQEGSVQQLEAKTHMPVYSLKDMLRHQMEQQQYAYSEQQDVIQKVKVVPGEVERFYRRMSKDSLPTIAEQYVYAHITKFPKGLEQAKRRTRERLLEMRERITSGKASFATMARMYSVDGSAIRGGELEPTPLQGFEKPFGDALGELEPGQVSEIVETQYGYHIIQMIDRKGQAYHCRHILLRPTYTNEEIYAPMKDLDSLANLIRKDSLDFAKAALEHSDDKFSNQNGGIVSNHDIMERAAYGDAKLTSTRFLKEDFGVYGKSLDDYNAIRRLQPGEVSSAFHTHDLSGNDLCKIVKLVEIIPSHTASLDDDYLRLEEMALSAKQEKEFARWLDTKIEQMYIWVTPEMRTLEFENKKWIK